MMGYLSGTPFRKKDAHLHENRNSFRSCSITLEVRLTSFCRVSFDMQPSRHPVAECQREVTCMNLDRAVSLTPGMIILQDEDRVVHTDSALPLPVRRRASAARL